MRKREGEEEDLASSLRTQKGDHPHSKWSVKTWLNWQLPSLC